jgi:hypothetical protein
VTDGKLTTGDVQKILAAQSAANPPEPQTLFGFSRREIAAAALVAMATGTGGGGVVSYLLPNSSKVDALEKRVSALEAACLPLPRVPLK